MSNDNAELTSFTVKIKPTAENKERVSNFYTILLYIVYVARRSLSRCLKV